MLRRLRRPLILLVPVVLAGALLSSCGSSTAGGALGSSAGGLDAVTIAGDVGAEPDVTWNSTMTADTADLTTLTTGTGPSLAAGDGALIDYWVGNGTTKQSAVFDTFAKTSKPVEINLGKIPTSLTTIDDLVTAFVASEVTSDVTVGSRLAITVSATNLFGQNVFATDVVKKNIGNEDGILIVVDVISKVLAAPAGAQNPLPAWSPTIVFNKDKTPKSLDFKGTPALGDTLKVGVLKQGTGASVTSGQDIVVDYLGQVYQGAQPFDQSYTTQDLITPIGTGAVVKGWDQALVGQKVGSRVVLGIPPALGYGKTGQGKTIPPNSPLYFVIDILAAS